MKIITINIGSRSKKYSLFNAEGEVEARLEIEGLEEGSFGKFVEENNINAEEVKVGIRIVAPGKFFVQNRMVDDGYLANLKEAAQIAPLHIEPVIKEIDNIKNKYPGIEIYAASDSAFHKSIPDVARVYAIPEKLRREYGIERQGYHGLSLASVVAQIQKEMVVPEKMVVCHMGGGTSVTALKDGLSVDTSMGWTPLEGVPMAERVGSIDPGVLAFISQKLSLNGIELEKFISTECGIEAISGSEKGDFRNLLKIENEETDEGKRAKLALDVYTLSITKEIGRMAAILNGCDAIAFTGAIGERSVPMRKRIVKGLEYLNIVLDQEKNEAIGEVSKIQFLGKEKEKSVIIVPSDEASQIYIVAGKETGGNF